ncbi:enoyl-CoA hydratase-related protein, partial [Nonomuraea wenchangensis]|uniref:enoyl-CoA hydratase-related protein n=1 Tax=Nonomuraea wenchangensis TaxID=568860 RepID=UPI00332D8032
RSPTRSRGRGRSSSGSPAPDYVSRGAHKLLGVHLLLCEPVTGEEAERMGLVSVCVDDDQVHERAMELAVRLASGAQEAIRLTKYALNNWLRLAGPSFDASLAMEFLGFTGPDVAEGVRALREKRPPAFG